jgi:hypothetical protein
MNRHILGAAGVIASLGVVACGSATAGGSASTPSPSARTGRGLAGNIAFGQLVQITGPTLILSNSNGDSTVTFASTTTITQTSTGTVTDITAGSCLTATGTKDSTGALTAASVTLSAPTAAGSCTTFGGGGGGGGGTFSPRPSFSPPAGAAGLNAARGKVKAVSGTSVTLTEASGTTTTIDVPTTVKVTTSTVVTATALQTGECLTAIGTKASSGAVAARVLTISPVGANGCTAGFGGGFGRSGGFGGGFGGGGGGGGGSIGA